jgi:hypothetical protein
MSPFTYIFTRFIFYRGWGAGVTPATVARPKHDLLTESERWTQIGDKFGKALAAR